MIPRSSEWIPARFRNGSYLTPMINLTHGSARRDQKLNRQHCSHGSVPLNESAEYNRTCPATKRGSNADCSAETVHQGVAIITIPHTATLISTPRRRQVRAQLLARRWAGCRTTIDSARAG